MNRNKQQLTISSKIETAPRRKGQPAAERNIAKSHKIIFVELSSEGINIMFPGRGLGVSLVRDLQKNGFEIFADSETLDFLKTPDSKAVRDIEPVEPEPLAGAPRVGRRSL